MSEISVRIRALGGEDVAKTIAGLEAAIVNAEKRIAAAKKGSRSKVVQETVQAAGQEAGAYRAGAAQIEREEKLLTRAKLRELALRGDAQKKFIDKYKEAMKLATAAFEAEVGKRENLTDREKRQLESVALAMVSEWEQAERRKTATTERQTRERQRLNRQIRHAFGLSWEGAGRGATAIAGAGASIASRVHDDMQGARERRAGVDHTLNGALYQAGVSGEEAQAMRATIRARAQALGMDPGQLAEGLSQAQTQFSVLSGRTAEERRTNLGRQLDLAEFAQSTYQDPAEVMRVAGMLQSQGVTGTDQRQTLLAMTGIAQAGSVELADIVSRGLGPLMQNISIATGRLGPGATAEQRSAAVREATLRTMAMQEVASRGGGNVRASMNAFASFERALQNDRVATNMRASLRSRGFTDAQIGEVLTRERDPRTGRMRDGFRSTDALVTLSRLNTMFQGNTSNLMNALSSGGPGLPTVLLSNIRTLAATLNSQTENGETVQQRVERMRSEGAQFTEADVARGRGMVQGEEQTNLQRQQQERDAALLANTGGINDLSNKVRRVSEQNPILVTAMSTLGTAIVGLLGAKGVGVLAGGAGGAANLDAVVSGRNLSGERLSVGNRVARAGAIALGPLVSGIVGVVDMYNAASSQRGREALLERSLAILPEQIARSLRDNPPQVTIDPHAAVHQQTASTTRRPGE